MLKFVRLISLVFLASGLLGCKSKPEVQTTPSPPVLAPTTSQAAQDDAPVAEQEGVFISELLPGVPGGNNTEFIELYNAGPEPVSLEGWSLWYLLGTGQEEAMVFAWTASAEIPGQGHYLLVRQGQTFSIAPDALFDTSLFERKGGLKLRNANGVDVDRLGWGDAPEGFYAGQAIPAPDGGASIERRPGGDMGNGVNSGQNSQDLFLNASPNPQNSGSPPTPLPERRLEISLSVPDVILPGSESEWILTIDNFAEEAVGTVRVTLPLIGDLVLLSSSAAPERVGDRLTWEIGEMAPRSSESIRLSVKAPYTYLSTIIRGYHAETDGFMRAYGPPRPVSVSGGAIPVDAARGLVGNTVTVEGTATMYTGGFFAGSTGTKFYISDEKGGVQVYVPGGNGLVNVEIGELVSVTGEVQIYRDSIEIVVMDVPGGVEVQGAGPAVEPVPSTILQNETDPYVLGKLITAEGIASRIEEFTYSYEIDLTDEEGNTTLIYIDKLTGATTEPLEVGNRYRITGISEVYNGVRQIYPRLQRDIVEVFPPVLSLSISAPNNAVPGDELLYTITAVNHTDNPLTNLQITAEPPAAGASLTEVLNGGFQEDGSIVWRLSELAGQGGTTSVGLRVILDAEATGYITMDPAVGVADQWPEAAKTSAFLTFVGEGVPIWAIQGEASSSPYVRSDATTEGIVTAVFPELGGFWIQELETDDNPITSAGVFILAGEGMLSVSTGDLVRVTGRVREVSGETRLQALEEDGITLIGSGNHLPSPIVYDPPVDVIAAGVYNESLEGMLVTVPEEVVVVAPTTQYGEYAVVYPKWGIESVKRTDEVGYLIFVDDGSTVAHENQASLPYAVSTGDRVSGLTGPLAFSFGNYKIEPVSVPEIVSNTRPLPTFPVPGLDQFSVATFNVENLFDLIDPHPSSPPRPSLDEYRLKLTKLAEAVLAMGTPTIVGLQEVENIGVLEDLVEQEQLAAFDYQPFLVEGTDSRGIDVGYIVRADQATVESLDSYNAPDGLTSRPPLAITVTVHLHSGDIPIHVLNNHFTSLSGGVEATEPRRTAQAAWNVAVMERIREADPDGLFIVLGDFNSFYDTLPIHALQNGGLNHVYEFFSDVMTIPYTYIFEGRTQTLDHILVSKELFARLVAVDALHIDADYPIASPDDATARRVSDHDPLVVIFSFQ